MSDWEIKNLQNQFERLEKKFDLQNDTIRKKSTTNFIWLIVLSNILFWFCIYHIELRCDINKLLVKQPESIKTSNLAQKNIKT